MTLWMYLSIFRCNFAIKAAENILSCQVSEMELWRSLSQLIWAKLLNAALWLAELRAAPSDRLGGLGRRQESLRGALMLFFLRPPSHECLKILPFDVEQPPKSMESENERRDICKDQNPQKSRKRNISKRVFFLFCFFYKLLICRCRCCAELDGNEAHEDQQK